MKVMRKICVVVLLVVLSVLNVSAKEGVSITDIQCSNMTDGKVKENMDVKVNGLNIDVEDTKFGTVGDYMKCTLEVTNDSDDSVSVNETPISNLSNDYIQYELLSDSKEIKKGEKAKYNLNINYKKEYEEDKTIDNVVKLELISDNMKNPSTSSNILGLSAFVVFILVLFGIMAIYKRRGFKMMVLLFILGVVTIPSVMALTSVKITLNNRIIIETSRHHVYYRILGDWFKSYVPQEKNSKYILTENSVCDSKPMYFENDSKRTKYLLCTDYLIDLGTYKANSPVELVGVEFVSAKNCEEQSNQFLCKEKGVWVDRDDNSVYDKQFNSEYQENDKDVMNFTEGLAYDKWESFGYFGFRRPNTFTMPNHDVYFFLVQPPI